MNPPRRASSRDQPPRRVAPPPRRPPAPGRRSEAPSQATQPKTDWSGVADWYDQLVGDEGSEYHRHVVLPGVLRLLDAQPGQRVLDVACGQGVLCRMLGERGVAAMGVDAAEPLITAARERGGVGAEYLVADARRLAERPELRGRFDAAACVLAIQNINPMGPVFEGVAAALKDAGQPRFVLALTHPAFRGPKAASWGWDDDAGVQYRRIDRYLRPRKEPIATHPGSDPSSHTWTFHRPLQLYMKALRQAGFMLDALEEWCSHKVSDSGPRAPAENLAREEIPLFLALRAVKIDAPK